MIREIVKNPLLLSKVSKEANKEDESIGIDLLDTLLAHQEGCVGMAANMIGFHKNIIAFQNDDGGYVLMYNPEIIQTFGKAQMKLEGCLCHEGVKEAMRYDKIKVRYLDKNFKLKIGTYRGFTAQIIQHEIDHCQGILI